jgi:hypothetical protein
VTIFPTLVYSLCFATSALCAYLLGRGFLKSRSRLLLWSSACFALLALANGIVILDIVIFPEIDFRPVRLWMTLLGICVLLIGFIWDEDT